MAKVTNALDTYTAKGDREDLSNVISMISPEERPVSEAIGRRDVSNPTFDWQEASLPAASSTPDLEGAEITRAAATTTTRESNVAMILSRNATVTGTQQAADAAGRGQGEMAWQMSIMSRALARDVEKSICAENGKVTGDATTARKTRAWESWISTNTSRGTGGANAANATSAPTDGTQRVFTETLLTNVLQTAYENGAEPTILNVGPFNKVKVSGFTGRSSARQNIDADAVQQSVSVYASDFGTLNVVANRFSRGRSALLIDPEYAAIGVYRNYQQVEISNIGDAETRLLLIEMGLEMKSESAQAIVADLTTS